MPHQKLSTSDFRIPPPYSPEREAEHNARMEADKRSSVNRMMKEGGFPALHMLRINAGLTTTGRGAMWYKAHKAVCDGLKIRGSIIALLGKRGVGKTQIATASVYDAAMCCADSVAKYVRAMEFFMAVKDAYSASTSERNAFDLFTRPSVLVLDEVQVRNGSAWESNALTYLIDSRYAAMRSTILISNELPEAFAHSMGDSVMDRLTETGTVIGCTWDSFRHSDAGGTSHD